MYLRHLWLGGKIYQNLVQKWKIFLLLIENRLFELRRAVSVPDINLACGKYVLGFLFK
jgi:hypothetical protein